MYELQGTIKNISFDYQSGGVLYQLALENKQAAIACVEELKTDTRLTIKIDRYREKRSLNANSYCWAILTKIGNKLRLSKEEVYFQMLKRYGQSEMISVQAHITISEYIKYSEEVGEGTVNGKLFKHYLVFKGSSEFNKEEMAIFIDGVVSEAKDLGIQTETPERLENLKSLWGE